MSQQIWSAVDGRLLKDLREKAGVEITTLAMKQCLSNDQIKQLEDGGDSSFYSPAIKLATGRKLLLHFGADITPTEPLKSQPEQGIQPKSVPAPQPAQTQTGHFLDTPQGEMAGQETTAVVSNKFSRYLLYLIPVAVATSLGIIFLFLSTTRFKKEIKPENFVAQKVVTPPILDVASKPNSIVLSAAAVSETPSKTPSAAAAECNWSDAPMPLGRYQPNKPGDYVHVVADTESLLCVKDASDTLQVLQLKSGQSQTVRGRPPFVIYSQQLHQFKFFYQGNLLRPPNNNIQNIILKEQKYE